VFKTRGVHENDSEVKHTRCAEVEMDLRLAVPNPVRHGTLDSIVPSRCYGV
jgi:hypothetical protein